MYTPIPDIPYRLPEITNSNKTLIICPKCHSLAEPYKVPGYDHTNPLSYKCTSCSHIDFHYKFIRKEYSAPLGSVHGDYLVRPAEFNVIQTKRNIHGKQRARNNLGRGRNSKHEVIPPLAGKPDRDLEVLLQHGILVNLQDSVMEEE